MFFDEDDACAGSQDPRAAGCPSTSLRQQCIHLREKNIVGPTGEIKNALRFLVRRVGTTFFDEDDACAGSQDPRAAGCPSTSLRQQCIHLREKNIVGPTGEIKNALRFLVRRAGPTFFDEDDAYAGSGTHAQPG